MIGVLFFLLTAPLGHAGEMDYSLSAATRSLPFGAALLGEAGFNQVFWGEKTDGNHFYGYVRPALKFRTSGVVHRVEPSLSVYPVSFIGLHVSYGRSYRATELDTLDCTVLECRGSLTRFSTGFSWVFGASGAFAGGSTTFVELTPSLQVRDFGEESSSLAGHREGDRLLSNELFGGYEFSKAWKAGAMLNWDHMKRTNAGSTLLSLFGRYESGAWMTMVGAGTYESSTAARGLTIYGLLRWTPQ